MCVLHLSERVENDNSPPELILILVLLIILVLVLDFPEIRGRARGRRTRTIFELGKDAGSDPAQQAHGLPSSQLEQMPK
jgi:hypothetical protein